MRCGGKVECEYWHILTFTDNNNWFQRNKHFLQSPVSNPNKEKVTRQRFETLRMHFLGLEDAFRFARSFEEFLTKPSILYLMTYFTGERKGAVTCVEHNRFKKCFRKWNEDLSSPTRRKRVFFHQEVWKTFLKVCKYFCKNK